ncbi:MAG: efflux RND transporter periplasmic adaptor subunit [Acidobacteriota bacterium]|nr:efflux RND transporter periplasmic adaptor subunit [Acidobacteriota bacterium]MDQ2840591.1 efflux RND transporter periplasmic adaptor subunit [Acidobacteriota bacterium]
MSWRRRTKLLARFAAVLLVIAGSGFAFRKWRHSSSGSDLPTAAARKGDFLVMIRCRGELVAKHSVLITAPLDVPDLQIVYLAPPGSEVKVGETVIRFDPSRSQQDLKEKDAALKQAQATLDQAIAQARITADQDKLDLATAIYNRERAQLEASKQAIVSVAEGQKSAIDLDISGEKVKVQEATAALHAKSDEAKIASLTRLRDAASAEVDLIQQRLKLMELKSPLNGVVNYASNYAQGWMNAQPFKVGDHAVGGTTLAEVPDLATLQMESKVDEVDRGRLLQGDAVLVHVDAFPEKVVTAKLMSISPLTEQSFSEWPPTRSFRAFALLEHPDGRMRPGMNAGADIIEAKLPNAVSIPAKALFTLNGKPAVYVKVQEQYLPHEVRVRARNPDEVAVYDLSAGTPVALAEPVRKKS